MSRALILGGGAPLRRCLAETLAEAGYAVFATARRYRADTAALTHWVGDAADPAGLRGALAEIRPDAVLDFLPLRPERAEALLAPGRHLLACGPASAVTLRAAAPAGAPWTVLRLGTVFAETSLPFGAVAGRTVAWRAARGLPTPIPAGLLDRRAPLTWGWDAAALIARALLNPKVYGRTLPAATAERLTWRDVLAVYRSELGATAAECPPAAYLRALRPRGRLTGRPIDNRALLAATGLRSADLAPVRAALAFAARRCREELADAPVDWALNARLDALAGVRPRGLTAREWAAYRLAAHPRLAHAFGRLAARLGWEAYR